MGGGRRGQQLVRYDEGDRASLRGDEQRTRPVRIRAETGTELRAEFGHRGGEGRSHSVYRRRHPSRPRLGVRNAQRSDRRPSRWGGGTGAAAVGGRPAGLALGPARLVVVVGPRRGRHAAACSNTRSRSPGGSWAPAWRSDARSSRNSVYSRPVLDTEGAACMERKRSSSSIGCSGRVGGSAMTRPWSCTIALVRAGSASHSSFVGISITRAGRRGTCRPRARRGSSECSAGDSDIFSALPGRRWCIRPFADRTPSPSSSASPSRPERSGEP